MLSRIASIPVYGKSVHLVAAWNVHYNATGYVDTNKRYFSANSSNKRKGDVRVRFAPSPTGEMHLGGLRTAMYNWLFAQQNNGQFILRIEDTDQTRLVEGAKERIIRTLEWAGLSPDEGPDPIGGSYGPYVQSERLHFYNDFVQKLLDNGTAYRCFCTEHRLALIRKDANRRREKPKYDNKCRHLSSTEINELMNNDTPHVVRFKLKEGPMTFHDAVFREVTIDLSLTEGDFILMKSDGYPTYHLANVVDDHLMNISHVLRGVEWQLSTPKHLQIFDALGLSESTPVYAHLPLMMNHDGTKLSKRNHGFMCEHLWGKYEPEAVLNFLVLSGGGFGKPTGQFCHPQDLIKTFDMETMNTHSCKIDFSRLDDVNRLCIGALAPLLEAKALTLVQTRYPNVSEAQFKKAFHSNVTRLSVLEDLISPSLQFLWADLPKERLIPDTCSSTFNKLIDGLKSCAFEEKELGDYLKRFHKEHFKTNDLSFKEYMKTLRLLLSGLEEGPGVAVMMVSLGKERTTLRLSRGL